MFHLPRTLGSMSGLLTEARHALLVLTIVHRSGAARLQTTAVVGLHSRLTVGHWLTWLLIVALLRHLLLAVWRGRSHRWRTHVLLLLHWRSSGSRGGLVLLPARQDEDDCCDENGNDGNASNHASSNRTGIRFLPGAGSCSRARRSRRVGGLNWSAASNSTGRRGTGIRRGARRLRARGITDNRWRR